MLLQKVTRSWWILQRSQGHPQFSSVASQMVTGSFGQSQITSCSHKYSTYWSDYPLLIYKCNLQQVCVSLCSYSKARIRLPPTCWKHIHSQANENLRAVPTTYQDLFGGIEQLRVCETETVLGSIGCSQPPEVSTTPSRERERGSWSQQLPK